ncbi:MAG: hypothetical protein KJ955_04580 [Nanoarchaeota archaeon]|nr:hypothetical protein [Nanoarchaeota archaeon]
MSYSPLFSTENADYRLVYALHFLGTREDLFEEGKIESLDAIVLESGIHSIPYSLLRDKQYEYIFNRAYAARMPLFVVDVKNSNLGWMGSIAVDAALFSIGIYAAMSTASDIKKKEEREKISRRDLLRIGAKGISSAWLCAGPVGQFISSFFKGESTEIFANASASVSNVFPTPMTALRNAIAARKVEEHVAPLLQARLKRNPNILFVYGSLHAGIEGCIQHKWWRDRIIDFSGITGNIGIKEDELNKVYELEPDENGEYGSAGTRWNLEEYECNLF